MKHVNETPVAQGDVLFRKLDSLPNGAKPTDKAGSYVVAHSETGHHHVARPARRSVEMERFEDSSNTMKSYLRIREKRDEILAKADAVSSDLDAMIASAQERRAAVEVEHMRSFDTHESLGLMLPEGQDEVIFEVTRQRQAIPEGWAAVVD